MDLIIWPDSDRPSDTHDSFLSLVLLLDEPLWDVALKNKNYENGRGVNIQIRGP